MGSDVKLLILGALVIGGGAWLLTYSSQAAQLVSSGAGDYGTVVHALEPPSLGGGGYSAAPSAQPGP